MPKRIKLWINTGFNNCKYQDEQDLPDDWDTMSEEEREQWLEVAADVYLLNHIDYGAAVVDGQFDEDNPGPLREGGGDG